MAQAPDTTDGVPAKGAAPSAPDDAPAYARPARAPVTSVDVPASAPPAERAKLAPFPLIDRYPTIVGSNLSLTYLASVYRLALTGYRREFVDALAEILERDPHLFAVLNQRVQALVGARLAITPSDPQNKRSVKIAKECERRIRLMTDLRQSLAALALSGLFYGVGASETSWAKESGQWMPKRLHFIHSRRLNYPDPGDWELRIWDQGQVYGGWGFNGPQQPDVSKTAKLFGIKASAFPGKFVVYSPQLRADYPTREGVGRVVAIWSALKTMGARSAAQYIERFAKPWALAYFKTTKEEFGRAAVPEDIATADAALRAVGTGSMAGATLPDSIKLELIQIADKGSLTHQEWIELCNKEISKAVVGQTETTEASAGSGYAQAAVHKTGLDQLVATDAFVLAEVLKRDLVDWIVRLNWPTDLDKAPNVTLVLEPEPDPTVILDKALKAVTMGAPVDADEVCERAGVPLIDLGNPDARILALVSPVGLAQIQPEHFSQLALQYPELRPTPPTPPGQEPDGDDEGGTPPKGGESPGPGGTPKPGAPPPKPEPKKKGPAVAPTKKGARNARELPVLAREIPVPPSHKEAMRVPKGGADCAKCRFVSEDGKACTNTYFIEWNGGDGTLPAPADEYCSDWFEPAPSSGRDDNDD